MKAEKGDQYGTKMRRTHLKSTKIMEQCKNSGNQTVKEAKEAFFIFIQNCVSLNAKQKMDKGNCHRRQFQLRCIH